MYILDAYSLIQLEAEGSGMRLLERHKASIRIPKKVAKEVGKRQGTPLRMFLEGNPSVQTEFVTPAEGESYLRLRAQAEIHDADAEAIAIALKRAAVLVTEDAAARAKATNHGVGCLTAQRLRDALEPRLPGMGRT